MHIITRKQKAQDYYGGKNKSMRNSCTPINDPGRSEIHIHKPWHLNICFSRTSDSYTPIKDQPFGPTIIVQERSCSKNYSTLDGSGRKDTTITSTLNSLFLVHMRQE